MAVAAVHLESTEKSRAKTPKYYRVVWALSFSIFLMVALVARLGGWKWQPWPPGQGGYKSVVVEAKRAVDRVVPLAFSPR